MDSGSTGYVYGGIINMAFHSIGNKQDQMQLTTNKFDFSFPVV
jgi:hypothetical protein